MFDLGVTERERREGESDQIEEDPEVLSSSLPPKGQNYYKTSRASISSLFKGQAPIPAPRVSRVRSQGVKLDQLQLLPEPLECSRL